MDNTPNLQLPYLIAAQAQKHVTLNEALRTLDAVVQLLVLDKDLANPPGSPSDGSRYIVAASPTGAWTGQVGKIAAYQDGAWLFYTPREGWLAWIADEDKIYAHSGSAWAEFVTGAGSLHDVVDDATPQLGGDLDANGHNLGFDSSTGITDDAGNEQLLFHKTASAVNQVGITNAATGNAPQVAAEGGDTDISLKLRGKGTGFVDADKLGVNATADTTNRLAVKSAASLFDNVGNGHQQKINKAAAGDTASVLYQTGYSGRAEFGLTGDDDFHVMVSPDGSTWHEALIADRSSGDLGFGVSPGGARLHVKRNDDLANTDVLKVTYKAGAANVNDALSVYNDSGLRVFGIGSFGGFYEGWLNLAAPSGQSSGVKLAFTHGSGTGHFQFGGGALIFGNNAAGGTTYFDGASGGTTFRSSAFATLAVLTDAGDFGFGTASPSNKVSAEGIVAPQTGNAYTLGTASKRWSEVYAATGTINTSDGRLKTGVQDSQLGLAFVLALKPRAFQWLEGGTSVEWDEESYQEEEPLTEAKTVTHGEVEMVGGVAVQRRVEKTVMVPVVDLVPVVDEAGAPVLVDGKPRLHPVPRMATVTKTRKVKREVPRAGVRTHYGLIAQEVQAALSQTGVGDFAGWVLGDKNDPDSTQGLRYNQFIAPLIKSVQELAARVAALEARLAAS